MDIEIILDGLSNEIYTTLNAMGKTKNADEKLTYSKTVKNLCDSLEVCVDLLDDIGLFDDDDDDGKPIPF